MIERIMEYGFTFLAGAFLIKLCDWFLAKKQREIANLQEQLKTLYGRLHFLVSQNQQCFKQGKKVTKAHLEESEGRQFPQENFQEVRAEADTSISVSNDYSRLVKDNNAQIRKLLEEIWHLIDEDDVEVFVGFLDNHTRMNVEAGDGASNRLPPSIARRLDPIFSCLPDSWREWIASGRQRENGWII